MLLLWNFELCKYEKVVVRLLTMSDEKTKQKAMEAAADILGKTLGLNFSPHIYEIWRKCAGVDSISVDVMEKEVTVVGEMDAVAVVKRLKKVG